MEQVAKTLASVQEWFKLGVKQMDAGHWAQAEFTYRSILAQVPKIPEVHLNLGSALKSQGKLEEAIASFQAATALRPNFIEAWNNLGDVLRETNRPAQAIDAFKRALALKPDFPDAWNNLGITYQQMSQPNQAIDAYRRALSLRPKFPEVWNNLGNTLVQYNQLTQAIDAFRRSLAARGDFSIAWSNLAGALKDTGQLDQALASIDRAISLQPLQVATYDTRLCTIHYHSAFKAQAIYQEARRWNDRFGKPLAAGIAPHDNDRSPERRLRVGYVSPDFRRHCQALFTPPFLANHDRSGFEIFCYSSATAPDAVTARLQRHGHVWRDIPGLTDQNAARLIRQDKIDILVDLTLHMAANRLGIFTRKPAPIQVTWLGYPGTTGLETMDYRLTDPRLDPPIPEGEGNINGMADQQPAVQDRRVGIQYPYYVERSVHLPDSFWCYDPRGMEDVDGGVMPDPGPLPALSQGRITFGCLNNFCKVTDATLALWARVLGVVPGSQIIMLSPPGTHRELVMKKLGPESRQRVHFAPFQHRQKYLATYRRIDICLDTTPYNGHTTTLDALWMGVPVVSRVGPTVVGRGGLSQLHNLGLLELVAWNDEQYVKLAVEWAGDIDRLCRMRATLRERIEQSVLMDGPRFTRNLEAAYRQMWRAWCRSASEAFPSGGSGG